MASTFPNPENLNISDAHAKRGKTNVCRLACVLVGLAQELRATRNKVSHPWPRYADTNRRVVIQGPQPQGTIRYVEAVLPQAMHQKEADREIGPLISTPQLSDDGRFYCWTTMKRAEGKRVLFVCLSVMRAGLLQTNQTSTSQMPARLL